MTQEDTYENPFEVIREALRLTHSYVEGYAAEEVNEVVNDALAALATIEFRLNEASEATLAWTEHLRTKDERITELEAEVEEVGDRLAEAEARAEWPFEWVVATRLKEENAALRTRIAELEGMLRDIAEERVPPDIEGDSEAIRYYQQDAARTALSKGEA